MSPAALGFTIETPADRADLVVQADPGATVRDVLAASQGLVDLSMADGTSMAVDGVVCPLDAPLRESGLRDGSILALSRPRCPTAGTAVEMRGVVGTTAGLRVRFRPGSYLVGAETGCDLVVDAPGVAARHARIAVPTDGGRPWLIPEMAAVETRVRGEAATGAVAIPDGSLVQIGSTGWVFGPARDGPVRSSGVFVRPPRRVPPAPEPVVEVPALETRARAAQRFRWLMLAGPLLLGGMMALLYGPRMVWIAVMSPVLMVGAWLDDRRESRRTRRMAEAEIDAARARLAAALRIAGQTVARYLAAVRPDLGRMVDIARLDDPALWERRPPHADFLHALVGYGSEDWRPLLHGSVPSELAEMVRGATLEVVPIVADLSAGHSLGVCGPRAQVSASLRAAVVGLAVQQGPAHLRLAIVTDTPRHWDWAKWLPHIRVGGGRLLVGTPEATHAVVGAALHESSKTATVLVIDGPLAADQINRIREAQSDGDLRLGILLGASSMDGLPSLCSATIELGRSGESALLTRQAEAADPQPMTPVGVPVAVAEEVARCLAAVEDPEVVAAGEALPDAVALLDLLGMSDPSPHEVAARWRRTENRVAAPLGVAAGNRYEIDLVRDGPHGLLAGTTGAGKSELLRTLVAGLAASVDPGLLNFVLIDYKGGSAFDACARLPHTVGVVTDLDEHLGARAMTCLEAEVRHRERLLRAQGARDLAQYQDLSVGAPLPRLVIVIDEFAALAAELPDFMDALVDIAQRGRSLGVHLLLATQRPAGVVKDNIRANTNLRISLRVQDPADSKDVIGTAAAADLPRNRPGRAYARLGPAELELFQTALVGGRRAPTRTGPAEPIVRPLVFAFDQPEAPGAATGRNDEEGPSDLDRLVDAIVEAAAGRPRPRRPWPDPLPADVSLSDVDRIAGTGACDGPAPSGVVPFGIADEPENQRLTAATWCRADGNLLLYGTGGSGAAEALETLAVSVASRVAGAEIYVIDYGSHGFGGLARLPQVGAVVAADDLERQHRLLTRLQQGLERRRRAARPSPPDPVFLVIDGLQGFLGAHEDAAGWAHRQTLARLIAGGPELGVYTFATANQSTAVPMKIAATVPGRLVFALADPTEYANFGIRAVDMPELPLRRAYQPATGRLIQVARTTSADLDSVVAASHEIAPVPPIEVLPVAVAVADVGVACDDGASRLYLPVGIGSTALGAVGWNLHDDDHVFIGGGIRAGKSTTLATVAETLAQAGLDISVAGVAMRRSPLRDVAHLARLATDPDALADLLEEVGESPRRWVLLIDDADAIDDQGGRISTLLAARRPGIHVVAAVATDDPRIAYGHWTKDVRRSRLGLLLRPSGAEGELLGVQLPRSLPGMQIEGRGVIAAGGRFEIVQVART